MEKINLLPYPRSLSSLPGAFNLTNHHFIAIDSPDPHKLFSCGRSLQETLQEQGIESEVLVGCFADKALIDVILRLSSGSSIPAQGYRLEITEAGVVIEGPDEPGIFYGICTLQQLLANQRSASLPCMLINDWPDFSARGVMLDISRDKVYTLPTLLSLVDKLASWKINQLQLYTEHTFAYRQHPEVWAKASPFTGEDVLALAAYCKEHFIDLVPNQNSFGHMHRWFSHPMYYPLGELAGVVDQNWWGRGSFSLCPGDPGSLALIKGLYEELLPHFSSPLFNVGCDETFDLGLGRSKSDCETRGKGRVYLDFLLKIYELVRSHNRTMQFWGDIIIQYPDLVPELPRDMIALEWGYEAADPPAEHCEKFSSAGIPYYVCPGTSSWNSIAGRTDNAIGNLRTAAQNGLKYGATGYLITDWGDNGHWQVLPVSYLGFAVGAAYAWSYQANQTLDVPRALSLHAFQDPSFSFGQAAYDLGNVYQSAGVIPGNSSAFFNILQMRFSEIRKYADRFDPKILPHVLEVIDQALKPLAYAKTEAPDAVLLIREFENTARLLRHACRRGEQAFGIGDKSLAELDLDLREAMIEYQDLWLRRNRPGGLVESLARFENSRQDYLET